MQNQTYQIREGAVVSRAFFSNLSFQPKQSLLFPARDLAEKEGHAYDFKNLWILDFLGR